MTYYCPTNNHQVARSLLQMRRLAHAAVQHRRRPPWRRPPLGRRTLSAAARGGITGASGGDAPVSREVASFFNEIVGAVSSASGAQREKGPAAAAAIAEAAVSNFPINIRPGWSFCGEIHIVDGSTSPASERRALRRLLQDAATSPLVPDAAGCIGVDTETRVVWNRSPQHRSPQPTTLLQLSARNTCVIYRLSDIRENGLLGGSAISTQLAALLGDYQIVKVGCGVMSDMAVLAWEEQGLPCVESMVELNTMVSSVPSLRRKNMYGLKSLAEKLMPTRGRVKKNKKITVSDWGLPLSHDHIMYAATDAWLGVELAHLVMERMVLEKTKQIQSVSNNNDNSLEQPSNHDNATMMRDLQPIKIFEKPGIETRAIYSASRYSRAKPFRRPKSLSGAPDDHSEVVPRRRRRPNRMPYDRFLKKLSKKLSRGEQWRPEQPEPRAITLRDVVYSNVHGTSLDRCTLRGITRARERYEIHKTVSSHSDLFSFSYVSSKDEAQRKRTGNKSKSIVVFRLKDQGTIDSLTEALNLVFEFCQSARQLSVEDLKHARTAPRADSTTWPPCMGEKSLKISVPVPAEDMWPSGSWSQKRYPVPQAAYRHISECLIHYKANCIFRKPDWHIQCKRNADDPLLMDLWAQYGQPQERD